MAKSRAELLALVREARAIVAFRKKYARHPGRERAVSAYQVCVQHMETQAASGDADAWLYVQKDCASVGMMPYPHTNGLDDVPETIRAANEFGGMVAELIRAATDWTAVTQSPSDQGGRRYCKVYVSLCAAPPEEPLGQRQ